MTKFTGLITGLVVAMMTLTAQSQTAGSTAAPAYPNKPVKVVVPYPPGGPTDIVARLVFQQVSEATGQQFVIDNRAGGGGNIGAEAVAHAPADGYTLLVATTAHAINMSLFTGLRYDVVKDFMPVSLLTQGPLVLVATPGFPANNVRELIALAKAKPDTLNFASSGNGQSTHLSGELGAGAGSGPGQAWQYHRRYRPCDPGLCRGAAVFGGSRLLRSWPWPGVPRYAQYPALWAPGRGRDADAWHVLHHRADGEPRQVAGESAVRRLDGGHTRQVPLGPVRAFCGGDRDGRRGVHRLARGPLQAAHAGRRLSLVRRGRKRR